MTTKKRKHSSPFRVIILGFLAMILIGAFLLMLPFSKQGEGSATFGEALFTSTSAICVTGLVVQDTATYWTLFGQGVIILLIQIGGLGVVTVAMTLAGIAGRKIGLQQRITMQEAISAPDVGGIVVMTKFILKVTFTVELIGALLFIPVFCRDFGFFKGLFYAFFHSISAFCNAGFDLMGVKSPFSSLTSYAADPLVNGTVMLLIIIGGIGFVTWQDVSQYGLHFNRYRLQTKVVLAISAVLILFPTLYFFFFEVTSGSVGERLLASLFAAVSPRTAGFNTVDLSAMSESGQAVTIVLMLIGGSPGSTAGGMKTTTVAVLIASLVAVLRRRRDTAMFARRVESDVVRNAVAVLTMYFMLFFVGGVAISMIEGLPLLTCLFESASAIGTVGLTLGVTPMLGTVSRIILIALMFFGRVGGLTLVFTTLSGTPSGNFSHFPREKITVG